MWNKKQQQQSSLAFTKLGNDQQEEESRKIQKFSCHHRKLWITSRKQKLENKFQNKKTKICWSIPAGFSWQLTALERSTVGLGGIRTSKNLNLDGKKQGSVTSADCQALLCRLCTQQLVIKRYVLHKQLSHVLQGYMTLPTKRLSLTYS